ncbi:S10 family peptidase [Paludibaculum fermentans]|uniref:S10 family peptidase n=1 Tax=Paludibaculum fermentans TaxID=1473598 RepID=UPI003EC0EE0E
MIRNLLIPFALGASLWAQQAPVPAPPKPPADPAPPIVKHQEITLNGKVLKYTSTTGLMPIRNGSGEIEATIFYMAYTLDGVPDTKKRRLMFSFNGGPGSASVWLHMGALGPKRVRMMDNGALPPAPYQLETNPATWLDETDLVFIDPVGTGYSRATKPELNKKFSSVKGDIESVGEFIRLYLGRNSRWLSPLFLVGESYGTTRAAGLSGHLIEKGIALNGVLLISTVLNFQTLSFDQGNDLPYELFLPTYTATAWYHKKLPADLQQKDLKTVLHEAEQWAAGGYAQVLGRGDLLTAEERTAAAKQLARFTGLPQKYVEQSDLRVEIMKFIRELRRDENVTAGRLDSRLTGPSPREATDSAEFDPSMTAIRPPYTAAFNYYVRTELGYESDLDYFILGGGIARWNWGDENRYADVSESLRSAFAKNPHMKLYVGAGYYDLATPYFAAGYTLNHMKLPAGAKDNIRMHYYEAGHMYYIDVTPLAALKRDAASFIRWAAQ